MAEGVSAIRLEPVIDRLGQLRNGLAHLKQEIPRIEREIAEIYEYVQSLMPDAPTLPGLGGKGEE